VTEPLKSQTDTWVIKDRLMSLFLQRFNEDLPESLNQSHRTLVVAGGIDSSTERIVQYLPTTGIGKVKSE